MSTVRTSVLVQTANRCRTPVLPLIFRWLQECWPTAMLLVGVVYLYKDLLVFLWSERSAGLWQESNSFLAVIPALVFCCGVIWRRGAKIRRRRYPRVAVSYGTRICMIAVSAHFVFWWRYSSGLEIASLVLLLYGLLVILYPRRAARQLTAAALVLMFLAPLPTRIHILLVAALQDAVCAVSTAILGICGMPVYSEGTYLFLPGQVLVVAEGCSGIRQLGAFLVLAHCLGVWLQLSIGRLLCVYAASLATAFLSNCLRVCITGWTLLAIGPGSAERFFHECDGIVLVAASSLMLYGFASRLSPRLMSREHAS